MRRAQTQRRYTVDAWLDTPQKTPLAELVDGIYEYQHEHFVQVVRLQNDDSLSCPLFPDLPLPVADLFAALAS